MPLEVWLQRVAEIRGAAAYILSPIAGILSFLEVEVLGPFFGPALLAPLFWPRGSSITRKDPRVMDLGSGPNPFSQNGSVLLWVWNRPATSGPGLTRPVSGLHGPGALEVIAFKTGEAGEENASLLWTAYIH